MSSSKYISELTYHLRTRGLAEDEVRSIVTELPSASDQKLERDFGSPNDYAEAFGPGSKKSTGWKLIAGSVAVAVLVMAIHLFSVVFGGVEQSLGRYVMILGGAALLVVVASIIAAYIDRRPVRAQS